MPIPRDLGPGLAAVVPLIRDPLHQRVYDELRRIIMAGGFAPGTEVTLKSVSQLMGTSEMPVRDAVRRLIAERALETLPGRRIGVPNLSSVQYREILRLRTLLEGEATREACRHLTKPELAAIRGHADELARGRAGGLSAAESLLVNQRFHFRIYAASHMPVLLAFIESLWLQIGPLFNHMPGTVARHRPLDYHGLAIDALEAGNAEAAVCAIEGDLASAGEVIVAQLEKREAELATGTDADPLRQNSSKVRQFSSLQ
jgi:DNA-binding GntR family transcriptional regulator